MISKHATNIWAWLIVGLATQGILACSSGITTSRVVLKQPRLFVSRIQGQVWCQADSGSDLVVSLIHRRSSGKADIRLGAPAYLVKALPFDIVSDSYYADQVGPEKRLDVVPEDGATPLVGLMIENNQIRGMYTVREYERYGVGRHRVWARATKCEARPFPKTAGIPLKQVAVETSYSSCKVLNSPDWQDYGYLLLPAFTGEELAPAIRNLEDYCYWVVDLSVSKPLLEDLSCRWPAKPLQ